VLHQVVGETIEQVYATALDTRAETLALHFHASGDLARCLTYSIRAAEQAERVFAHDEALRHYARARECATALNQTEQLVAIDEAIGDVYRLHSSYVLSVEHYTRALALASTPEQRAVLKRKIGAGYNIQSDERSLEFLQAALNELDPAAQTNELVRTNTTLGHYYRYRGQYSQALEACERARQLAESSDDASLGFIYLPFAGTYRQLARFDESIEWARKAVAFGEGRNDLVYIANGYEFIAEASYYLGRWQDVLTFAAQDKQVAEKIGYYHGIAWAEHARAWAYHGQGNLAMAMESIQVAMSIAEKIGEERLVISARAMLAVIETDFGYDETAHTDAARSLAHGDALGELLIRCMSRRAAAYRHLQREEWQAATEQYEQCAAMLAGTEERAVPLVIWPNQAEAYLGQGRGDEAAHLITEHLTLAREAKSRHYEAVARRVQGQIFAAQNMWDEAARAFDEAITTLDETGSHLELSRAFYQRGVMRHAQGDVDAARADWTRALELFEVCGMKRDVERARVRLAQAQT
jgi:tetratricopeptide (TPR) repeat protein